MWRIATKRTTTTALTRWGVRVSTRSLASLSLLKDLRAQSGAPIVDCKKALEQSNGDLTQAFDWLRKHGAAKASSKVAGRENSEGLVGLRLSSDSKSAALVKVASETDFAGRSSSFVDLVHHVMDATLESDNTGILEESALLSRTAHSKTVQQVLDEAMVAIRENLKVSRAQKMTSTDNGGVLVGYIHGRVPSADAGTAVCVVEMVPMEGKNVSDQELQEAGKKLAMHVVAAKPKFMSPETVPEADLEHEKDILREQISDSGKPPEIVEKIINGRLRKFYERVCLLEQEHMVEEENPKVSKALKAQGMTVKNFEYISIS